MLILDHLVKPHVLSSLEVQVQQRAVVVHNLVKAQLQAKGGKTVGEDYLPLGNTDDEKQRLRAEANRRGVTMSEVIQDYCKRLPRSSDK